MFRLQSRIFWLLMLLLHAIGAGGWGWTMPRGFPPGSARFWVNQVSPPLLIVLVIGALVAARRNKLRPARLMLIGLGTTWIAAAVCGRVIFPISLKLIFLAPAMLGAATLLAAIGPALRDARLGRAAVAMTVLLGLLIGIALPFTQRAPLASTHPLDIALADGGVASVDGAPGRQAMRGIDVNPDAATITLSRGRFVAYLQPLLTFHSRSPDRCWTCFAPPADRMGADRRLITFERRDGLLAAGYLDDGRSLLTIIDSPDGSASIDAGSQLPQPVYSHLNTFTELVIAGHRRLLVSFSPCPEARIEVVPFDYPVGRPARFAYVDFDRRFRVVEATDAEKGPFRTLAEGQLLTIRPLTITFFDGETPIARMTLNDFASQCSTALSPTAGWRVPVNAIEFSRDSDDPAAAASFFVTLGGSSVGRGFDSVGHAAGTYRNRLAFEWIGD